MKTFVQLRRAQQMLELFQSRERPKFKNFACHLDFFKHTTKFLRARARVALAMETGEP